MKIFYNVYPNEDSLGRLTTYTHSIKAEKGEATATYVFESISPIKLKLFEDKPDDGSQRD